MGKLSAIVLFCTLALSADITLAEDKNEVSILDLTVLDHQYLKQRRELIDELTRSNFGTPLRDKVADDLATMQRLLDRRIVKPSQRLELQAMGIVLGNLLARELGMRWVVYEDKLGRSRALRLRQTDHILFPVTMISRRAETGLKVDIKQVYQKAYDAVKPHIHDYRPKPPL